MSTGIAEVLVMVLGMLTAALNLAAAMVRLLEARPGAGGGPGRVRAGRHRR